MGVKPLEQLGDAPGGLLPLGEAGAEFGVGQGFDVRRHGRKVSGKARKRQEKEGGSEWVSEEVSEWASEAPKLE